MISFGDLKKGLTIEMDGQVYLVVEYQSQKMQQRAPVIRLKLKDIRSGKVLERSFQGNLKLTPAPVDYQNVQFLYNDGDIYYFMDTTTYEQLTLDRQHLGDAVNYLKDGLELQLMFYKGQSIGVNLPNSVELKVTDTPPGFKGDTAQSSTKPATLETGVVIQVPLFINVGEVLRVDTRTGAYLERA